ncbi:MAG TPA: methionine--tRNA ligase [bacterium]|nr:methionine--tRNA ligase [bacterium]HQQ38265.1 methionine--tRNA ligase [bacterium]
MSKENNFYITTTLAYTNSDPHLGFAAELIKADVIARWQSLAGKQVVFNTGTDEHGLKIFQQAKAAGLSPRAYCDYYAARFASLKKVLDLSFTNFIRTSDDYHEKAAQEFWRRCAENGDIYKKTYSVKYCVGCELEKTESELVNGRCPLHPNRELELIEEDNYFFRFSKYQQPLLDFYKNHPDFIIPSHRFTEIKNFVAAGLQDFSVSRLKSKMPNGVPVPGDDEQVMYVWFDALVNYISTLGWPNNEENFQAFWPAVQVCGKDNLRQQTAMWPAMLLSAGLPLSRQVLIFGFLTANGQKISKSLGNGVDLFTLVSQYGADALRYYLLTEIPPFEDGDFSEERLIQKYNADLANGLGNLVARVSNLLEKNNITTSLSTDNEAAARYLSKEENLASYQFSHTLQSIWQDINACNEELSARTPWKLTEREAIAAVLRPLAERILIIATRLQPFLPTTAKRLIAQFTQAQIIKGEVLFPRLDAKSKTV